MKKIKCILFLLLSCGILTYGGVKASVKSVYRIEKTWLDENNLKELRAKVKILFPDIIEYGKISPKYFEQDNNDRSAFTMRFFNIIYESRGKIVKVPIFRGTMGDILYDDFLKYCDVKGLMKGYTESGFKIEFEKGKFKKILNEFRKFYGRHLSIDFKKMPAEMYLYSGKGQINIYTFILDGVKGELSFYFPYDKDEEDEATKLEYAIRIK